MPKKENGTVATAPRSAILESLEDDDPEAAEDPGQTMHQILVEAGAKLDRNGTYYRIVPDPARPKRVVVQDGKRYLATETIRRDVAVGADPREAQRRAIAAKGHLDSYWPGIGWLRGGQKAETEHPSNLGILTPQRSRTILEPIEDDAEEQGRAIALKNVMDAAHREDRPSSRRAAREAPATPAATAADEAPPLPLVSVVEGEEDN